MNKSPKDLVSQLDWSLPTDVQLHAINALKTDTDFDYRFLVTPGWRKECWLNCAKILIDIGYPKNKDTLDGLFEWIQDMNWPGAKLIFNYLQVLPKDVFMMYYPKAIEKAIKQNDDMWLYNLSLYEKSLSLKPRDFSDSKLYNAMKEYY